MSLAIFKKKSINKYSTATKHSSKGLKGIWLPSGPFGNSNSISSFMLDENKKNPSVGYSINGSHRGISVGKDMKFSNQGTSFKGIYPLNYKNNNNSLPLLNVGEGKISVRGIQTSYIKQSVLSNKGMLSKKYKWLNRTYPNYWVQPIYTGFQTDTVSQELYINNKSSKNNLVVDTNNVNKYINYIKDCKSIINKQKKCNTGIYTKTLYQPISSSDRTIRVKRNCLNSNVYPFAVNTGSGILTSSISKNTISVCNNTITNNGTNNLEQIN